MSKFILSGSSKVNLLLYESSNLNFTQNLVINASIGVIHKLCMLRFPKFRLSFPMYMHLFHYPTPLSPSTSISIHFLEKIWQTYTLWNTTNQRTTNNVTNNKTSVQSYQKKVKSKHWKEPWDWGSTFLLYRGDGNGSFWLSE